MYVNKYTTTATAGFSLFSLIWICFTIRKTGKYFTETKIFITGKSFSEIYFKMIKKKLKSKKLCMKNLS